MNLKDYQKFALTTAVYPKIMVLKNPTEEQIKLCEDIGVELRNISWVYPLIGLVGECGELANVMKKTIRDDQFEITPEKKKKIIDEKGDVNWYSSIFDYEVDIDSDNVLDQNIDKLRNRKKTNTVHDIGRKES